MSKNRLEKAKLQQTRRVPGEEMRAAPACARHMALSPVSRAAIMSRRYLYEIGEKPHNRAENAAWY